MRVLVCGSRDFVNKHEIYTVLDILRAMRQFAGFGDDITIIQGESGSINKETGEVICGADLFAKQWAINSGLPHLDFPADWNQYGSAAGPIRNKQMLYEGKPDLVLAFPKDGNLAATKGTKNMVGQARAARIETIVHGK